MVKFEDHVRATRGGPAATVQYCALALNGEAGEVAEWVKKKWRDGEDSPLNDEDLLSELGDVLWYTTALALAKGWTLEQVADFNIEKLTARQAEGRKIG